MILLSAGLVHYSYRRVRLFWSDATIARSFYGSLSLFVSIYSTCGFFTSPLSFSGSDIVTLASLFYLSILIVLVHTNTSPFRRICRSASTRIVYKYADNKIYYTLLWHTFPLSRPNQRMKHANNIQNLVDISDSSNQLLQTYPLLTPPFR